MGLHAGSIGDLMLVVAALTGLVLALRGRKATTRGVAKLLHDGINGSALLTARVGVTVETIRITKRLILLVAGLWLLVTLPSLFNFYLLIVAVIVNAVLDDVKSYLLARARARVAELERQRVATEARR